MKQYLVATASVLAFAVSGMSASATTVQPEISTRGDQLLHIDGLTFKDLNHNGKLDPYEDWRLPAAARAKDLVQRMTLAEKAGVMMFGTPITKDGRLRGALDADAMKSAVLDLHISSFINRSSSPPGEMAAAAEFGYALRQDEPSFGMSSPLMPAWMQGAGFPAPFPLTHCQFQI